MKTNFKIDKNKSFWTWQDKNVNIKASASIEINNKLFHLKDAEKLQIRESKSIIAKFADFTWTLKFSIETPNCIILYSDVKNSSTWSIKLGKCCLVDIDTKRDECLDLGICPEKMTFFHASNSQGADRVEKIVHGVKGRMINHESDVINHLYNPASKTVFNSSFLTFDRSWTTHKLIFSLGQIQSYQAICDFRSFQLKPGKSITSEKIQIEISNDPYASLENWADKVKKIYKPKFDLNNIPAGWVGWSWADAFCVENFEKVAQRNLNVMKNHLCAFGIKYLWISLVNISEGLPGNWLEYSDDNFPGGFENMIEEIKNAGLVPGLWFAPFWIASHAKEAVEKNLNNLVKDAQGNLLIDKKLPTWTWDYTRPMQDASTLYSLDGTISATHQYLTEILEVYKNMGIRYYLLDFIWGGLDKEDAVYNDDSCQRGTEIYRRVMETVRRVTGPETHLLTGSGPTLSNVGVCDSERIGEDYGEGRHLNSASYPATKILNDSYHCHSHVGALRNMATMYFTHGRLYMNNLNILTVDKPMPRNDAEIATTMFAISGSPMMLGDDLAGMSDERLALIKKVLPRTPEIARPLDLFESMYPDSSYPHALALPVETVWGKWTIVAVFNLDNSNFEQNISLSDLPDSPGKPKLIWEFWSERYQGTFTDNFTARLAPNSCALFRVFERPDHPWIMSTDAHALQGRVELPSVHWNKKTLTLSGIFVRPEGERNNLFICSPFGFAPVNPKGLWVGRDLSDETLIIRKPISGGEKWSITFERHQGKPNAELLMKRKKERNI